MMVKRAASWARKQVPELGEWTGMGLVTAGCWQLSPASALIVAGVLVVVKANLS